MEFAEWLEEVEKICLDTWGLDMDSLFGDQATWSNWDAGITPEEFINEIAWDVPRS